jgi:hypothetical protein
VKLLSGRSRDWIKSKNPAVRAVKREAEEDWDKARWRYPGGKPPCLLSCDDFY